MITDIWTITQKELKELLRQRGTLRRGMVGVLIFIGAFGVFLPIQFGNDWVESPTSLLYWSWVPFLLVSGVIADSFAGERERHTLETLLASRLSDRAILFGKICAAIAYGWELTIVCLLLGLVTVNVAHGHGEILIYPLNIGLGIIGLSLLVAGFASGLGILISLRASTVRQAQQTFSLAFMLVFLPLLALPILPAEWQAKGLQLVMRADINAIVPIVAAMLFVLDIATLAFAMARFKRTQLILD